MSASHDHNHDDAHTGPIKTPKQLAWAVFLSFLVPIVIIILLANYVSTSTKPAAGTGALEGQAVAERIAPVGHVDVKDASDVASLATGDKVFQAQCVTCHGSGALGAPKLGDTAAWGPRLKSGIESLVNSALKGKGNMPPQGGGDFSDFEIHRAVVYLANQGGGKFDEPKAPAAAASAAN
ncbi:MAG: cytochrome c5 family protein [Rubrivivax sp.]|nr:MAG: cytochrome c5 family protein [Rubrivivax sp.]